MDSLALACLALVWLSPGLWPGSGLLGSDLPSSGQTGPTLSERAELVTLALALLFVFTQFQGFGQIIADGYYFTGAQSTITTSFWYVLVLLHLAHLAAGIIVLGVVYYNLMQNTYSPTKTLGFELAVTFWHFLDFLWLYLFFFVLLYR